MKSHCESREAAQHVKGNLSRDDGFDGVDGSGLTKMAEYRYDKLLNNNDGHRGLSYGVLNSWLSLITS